MAKAMSHNEQPTYEQLEEIIRRKDKLFKRSWNKMEEIRAILWMTTNAYESNQSGYSDQEYAIAACIVTRFIDRRIRFLDDTIELCHRMVPDDVLAGRPESEDHENWEAADA